MQRLLMIEDSTITHALVRSALKDMCHIETAIDGAEAMKMISGPGFDLILLDINLPDVDGFTLYEKIRAAGCETPVMFLTAFGDVERKVRGFNLGAEDYIVKPFQLVEFQARVAAKLRNLKAAAKRENSDFIEIGPFAVNLAAQKISLRREGKTQDLELTANQFKVLYYLLRHENQLVSREALLKEIWGDKVHVSDRTIDTHIYSIRQELGAGQKYLHSVHGKGYRLSVKPDARESA